MKIEKGNGVILVVDRVVVENVSIDLIILIVVIKVFEILKKKLIIIN